MAGSSCDTATSSSPRRVPIGCRSSCHRRCRGSPPSKPRCAAAACSSTRSRTASSAVRSSRGDGLRIFAGEVAGRSEPGLVASPWIPDASLDLGDGKVAPQFMWAALDCPGYFAIAPDGRLALLAEHVARIERRLRIDEPAVAIGWRIGGEGRVHEAGTALFGEHDELVASARAVWIEPRRDALAG